MTNTKRELKYKRLLNQLKDSFAHDLKLNDVKLRIKNKIFYKSGDISSAHTEYNLFTKQILKKSLNLNLEGIKNRAKNGFTNCYYQNRSKKLSFVLHNRKIARNFILCHELS